MATAVAKPERRTSRPLFPRSPLTTLRDEMHDLLTHTFTDEEESWSFGRTAPRLDLSETDATVEVRLDLPGVKSDDVDIQISGTRLNVSGVRKEEHEEKGRTWHRIERRAGKFCRSVMLPCPVKEDAADAHFADGILTIVIPKADEAKAHKIKIRS
jgi:HSP20 family protein